MFHDRRRMQFQTVSTGLSYFMRLVIAQAISDSRRSAVDYVKLGLWLMTSHFARALNRLTDRRPPPRSSFLNEVTVVPRFTPLVADPCKRLGCIPYWQCMMTTIALIRKHFFFALKHSYSVQQRMSWWESGKLWNRRECKGIVRKGRGLVSRVERGKTRERRDDCSALLFLLKLLNCCYCLTLIRWIILNAHYMRHPWILFSGRIIINIIYILLIINILSIYYYQY